MVFWYSISVSMETYNKISIEHLKGQKNHLNLRFCSVASRAFSTLNDYRLENLSLQLVDSAASLPGCQIGCTLLL